MTFEGLYAKEKAEESEMKIQFMGIAQKQTEQSGVRCRNSHGNALRVHRHSDFGFHVLDEDEGERTARTNQVKSYCTAFFDGDARVAIILEMAGSRIRLALGSEQSLGYRQCRLLDGESFHFLAESSLLGLRRLERRITMDPFSATFCTFLRKARTRYTDYKLYLPVKVTYTNDTCSIWAIWAIWSIPALPHSNQFYATQVEQEAAGGRLLIFDVLLVALTLVQEIEGHNICCDVLLQPRDNIGQPMTYLKIVFYAYYG
ncbi:hypothetical protein EV421DRAFT_1744000 [Armillaria borealis]|uniref:Uncharacterized protein n=1 Tax=Armillaria borealis TaxID=47425 RepID=A0AA39IWL5_9AGAR|nr:hypothetical protein EV421DRAFT_1744000 [Armillaria borealis]